MICDMSITSMYHNTLKKLDSAPFDDLLAEDEYGDTVFYSPDQFRRLYNDAVESMRAYRHLAEELDHDLNAYRQLVSSLTDRIDNMTTDPASNPDAPPDAHIIQEDPDSVPLSDFLSLTDAMVQEILLLEEEVIR